MIIILVIIIAMVSKWYWYDRYKSMIKAAGSGDLVMLKKYLDSGMNINRLIKETALISASWSGEFKIVKYLMDKGADINKKGSFTNWKAIQSACLSAESIEGRLEVVKLLANETPPQEIVDLITVLLPHVNFPTSTKKTIEERAELVSVLKSFISKSDINNVKNWMFVTPKTIPALESKMIGKVITNVYYKELIDESMKIGKEVFLDIDGSPYLKVVAGGLEGYAIQFAYTDSNDSNADHKSNSPLLNLNTKYKKTWSGDLVISDFHIRHERSTYDGALASISIRGTVNKMNDAIREIQFIIGSPDANFFLQSRTKPLTLFVGEGIKQSQKLYEDAWGK